MVTSHHPRCKRSRSLDLSSESPAVLWSLGCLMPSLRVLGALLGGTSQNKEQQEKKSKTHTHTNKPLQYGSGNTNACSPYCDCAGVCCDAGWVMYLRSFTLLASALGWFRVLAFFLSFSPSLSFVLSCFCLCLSQTVTPFF